MHLVVTREEGWGPYCFCDAHDDAGNRYLIIIDSWDDVGVIGPLEDADWDAQASRVEAQIQSGQLPDLQSAASGGYVLEFADGVLAAAA